MPIGRGWVLGCHVYKFRAPTQGSSRISGEVTGILKEVGWTKGNVYKF